MKKMLWMGFLMCAAPCVKGAGGGTSHQRNNKGDIFDLSQFNFEDNLLNNDFQKHLLYSAPQVNQNDKDDFAQYLPSSKAEKGGKEGASHASNSKTDKNEKDILFDSNSSSLPVNTEANQKSDEYSFLFEPKKFVSSQQIVSRKNLSQSSQKNQNGKNRFSMKNSGKDSSKKAVESHALEQNLQALYVDHWQDLQKTEGAIKSALHALSQNADQAGEKAANHDLQKESDKINEMVNIAKKFTLQGAPETPSDNKTESHTPISQKQASDSELTNEMRNKDEIKYKLIKNKTYLEKLMKIFVKGAREYSDGKRDTIGNLRGIQEKVEEYLNKMGRIDLNNFGQLKAKIKALSDDGTLYDIYNKTKDAKNILSSLLDKRIIPAQSPEFQHIANTVKTLSKSQNWDPGAYDKESTSLESIIKNAHNATKQKEIKQKIQKYLSEKHGETPVNVE